QGAAPAAPVTSASPAPNATTPPPPKARPKKDLAPALVTKAPGPVDSQLQADVQTMIRECLRFSPKIYGRRTNVWSTKALADVLAKNLGREVPRDQIRSFLQNAGVAKLETTQQFVKRTARMKAIDPATLPSIAEEPAEAPANHAEAVPSAATAPEATAEATPIPATEPSQESPQAEANDGQFADPWAANSNAPAAIEAAAEAAQNDALAVAGAPDTQQNTDS
ncbi:MAG: hypothetical protein P1V97_28200, partial [Planctomycetota bacterium]|nr:hypothetical protein [Planctomycetota bacterium]